jgi:hypothetical protein
VPARKCPPSRAGGGAVGYYTILGLVGACVAVTAAVGDTVKELPLTRLSAWAGGAGRGIRLHRPPG